MSGSGVWLLAIRRLRPSRLRQHVAGILSLAVLGLSCAVDAPGRARLSGAAPTDAPACKATAEGSACCGGYQLPPQVMAEVRFLDIPGPPAEVSQTLRALGVHSPDSGDVANSAATPLTPADTKRFLETLATTRAEPVRVAGPPLDRVSRPIKVGTRDGQRAVLRIVTERYFPESWKVVDRQGKPTTVPAFGVATDMGCVLELTPHLDPKRPGEAGLDMTARVTELGDPPYRTEMLTHTDTAGRRHDLPVEYANLNVRSVTATAVVPVGHSVCLYGGTLTTERQAVDKVPVLGSVPLLGRLFQTSRRVETAKALLVLVTLERAELDGTPPPAVP
jgi:hypothetical protein